MLSKLMLFEPVSQTNAIINDFSRSYLPIASIQREALFEFNVNRNGQLYSNPENTYLHIKVKITKANVFLRLSVPN